MRQRAWKRFAGAAVPMAAIGDTAGGGAIGGGLAMVFGALGLGGGGDLAIIPGGPQLAFGLITMAIIGESRRGSSPAQPTKPIMLAPGSPLPGSSGAGPGTCPVPGLFARVELE